MTFSKLQEYLWKTAGFNTLFVKHCPVFYNRFSSIGLYYILQIVIFFISSLVFFNDLWNIGLLNVILSIIASVVFYIIMLQFIRLQHKIYKTYWLSFVFILCSMLSTFTSLILLNFFFKDDVFGFSTEKSISDFLEYIFKNPEINDIAICVGLTIFSLNHFILFIPYLLIFKSNQSIYRKISNIYGKHYQL